MGSFLEKREGQHPHLKFEVALGGLKVSRYRKTDEMERRTPKENKGGACPTGTKGPC